MEAAVWTLIALLGASTFGGVFYLGSRIDALAARVDSRADRSDARLDSVIERLGKLEARVARLESKVDAHLDRHAS